jgi:Uma2 family endonuclease
VKRRKYARYGVREFWIVDPISRTIEVLSLSGEGFVSHGVFGMGGVVTSSVLPGFRLSVRDAFE